jgi:CRISPR-associated endonuclease Csy4
MHQYLDIYLRPDPEFPTHQLMAATFAKLHQVLAHTQAARIGVSFPGYNLYPATLGDTLRLFGSSDDLTSLMKKEWLTGVSDHVTCSAIAPVPATASARRLERVQAKGNPERYIRRQMRRRNLPETVVRATYKSAQPQRLHLPFVNVASSSSGQTFKLFLRLVNCNAQPVSGEFNTYGLSSTATVPWF